MEKEKEFALLNNFGGAYYKGVAKLYLAVLAMLNKEALIFFKRVINCPFCDNSNNISVVFIVDFC